MIEHSLVDLITALVSGGAIGFIAGRYFGRGFDVAVIEAAHRADNRRAERYRRALARLAVGQCEYDGGQWCACRPCFARTVLAKEGAL